MGIFSSHASSPPPMPPAPKPEDIVAKSKATERKKIRKGLVGGRTILTSPLGVQQQANVQTKTLLGE